MAAEIESSIQAEVDNRIEESIHFPAIIPCTIAGELAEIHPHRMPRLPIIDPLTRVESACIMGR
ncbi:MAG: hypothetical protein ACJA07_001517 [Rhodococcus sp. (in: high G+C Gram-positive bacteria)]